MGASELGLDVCFIRPKDTEVYSRNYLHVLSDKFQIVVVDG